MSIQRFGIVDIDGLWQLRKLRCAGPRFSDFQERKDMLRTNGPWHWHFPGTEYLAANPLVVPKLVKLIERCSNSSSDVVFSQLTAHASTHDPFDTLSPELRTMILDMLGPRDISNLRLSSKEFSQLHQSYFKQLIAKEMPWVWELHDNYTGSMPKRGIDWFALWSQLRVSDGGDCADEKRRSQRGGDKSHTYNEAEIRGLRNRRMIYRDISMILDMMADARTEMAR
jgi:hypothetical protein